MLNFTFYSPTRFIFGKGAQTEVGRELARQNYKKVLIHYGRGSAQKSGLLDEIKQSLDEVGIAHCELGGVQPNPVDTLIYKGIELARSENVDFILAVGGGSVIDSSKAIAAGIKYDGDFWDFYDGKASFQEALPLGSVLTIPAAGSEASSRTVVTKEDGLWKRATGGEVLRPVVAFMNPELTYTLPAYQTACGVVDMMAHVLERYCTQITGVELTDRLCEAVLKTLIEQAPIALADPTNYDARANIMWAGTIAHNDSVGLGRQGDWSSHQIEHELSAMYGIAHGAGLAVIFPAWMQYQYKKNIPLFAQLAVRVWNCEMNYRNPEKTALEGIQKMKAFFKSLGMPVTFDELGAKKEDIEQLTMKCDMNNGEYMGHFSPSTRDDIRKIYELACQ